MRPAPIESNENMDFLKKNPYPLAAYCFGLYSILQVFSTNGVVSTLNLLAYIFLTVMLFMKRRDILMVAAAAVPSVISLLSIIIYGTDLLGFLNFLVGLTIPGYVACFLLPQLEPHVGKFMDTLKKFWFVPAAALGVLLVLRLVAGFFSAISLWNSYYFYGSIFEALSYTSMNFFHFLHFFGFCRFFLQNLFFFLRRHGLFPHSVLLSFSQQLTQHMAGSPQGR